MAFIPVEKGPVEGRAPGWASPGGPARLPRRGVARARRGRWGARFTPGSFSVHPPRDSCWGGCKTHMTRAGNCCNTLARRREPSQAPRTTGPASCRGRQRAGLPAAPCLHRCPPAARTAGSNAPAAAFVLRQAHPRGAGVQPWRVAQPWVPLAHFQAFFFWVFSSLALLFVDPYNIT